MTSTPIPHVYHQTWWASMLRGLLTLSLGLFILAWPLGSVLLVALAIALWVVLSGCLQALQAAALRHVFSTWWIMLLSGLVSVLFGVAALVYSPSLSLTLVILGVAWWFLVVGSLTTVLATQERARGVPWGWTLCRGILKLIVGLAVVLTPTVTLAALLALLAVFATVSGVTLFSAALQFRWWPRDLLNMPDTADGVVLI